MVNEYCLGVSVKDDMTCAGAAGGPRAVSRLGLG